MVSDQRFVALMRLVEARPVPLLSPGIVKMEERKRPASYEHDDSAPPLKRQATTVNGASKTHPDADMPWKDELEVSLVTALSLKLSNSSHFFSFGPGGIWYLYLSLTLLCYSASRKMRSFVRCRSINGKETLLSLDLSN